MKKSLKFPSILLTEDNFWRKFFQGQIFRGPFFRGPFFRGPFFWGPFFRVPNGIIHAWFFFFPFKCWGRLSCIHIIFIIFSNYNDTNHSKLWTSLSIIVWNNNYCRWEMNRALINNDKAVLLIFIIQFNKLSVIFKIIVFFINY